MDTVVIAHTVSNIILFPVFLMNLSFAGSGFMGVYHLGVASCIKTYAPHILENKVP